MKILQSAHLYACEHNHNVPLAQERVKIKLQLRHHCVKLDLFRDL